MAFVFCLSPGGQNFLSRFARHLGKGDMFAFLLLRCSHGGVRETRVTRE